MKSSHTTATDPRVGPVEVYPVGLFSDARHLVMSVLHPRPTTIPSRWKVAAHLLRRMAKSSRRGSWWNGYLAEPLDAHLPWYRCGHGWTRRRALRSLDRHLTDLHGRTR